MEIRRRLHELGERWAGVPSAERANYQLYLIELAEAMGVLRPQPKGSGYEFEYPIKVLGAEASSTTKFADLYRRGHFLLEAKDQDAQESSEILMRRAFAQARLYAAWIGSASRCHLDWCRSRWWIRAKWKPPVSPM